MSESRPRSLAVFVTSHGFGHLNRTVSVLNLIPDEIPITIHCGAELITHWGERLIRPASFEPRPTDFGAYNPPGDSLTTDGSETIRRALEAHAEAVARIETDANLLRSSGASVVLCDAPATPLVSAKKAEIPAFLLANFTWADIYREHAVDELGKKLVAELNAIYSQATAIFRAEPALPLTGIAPIIEVGMVVTPGRDRRVELREKLGLATSDRLVYFYVGRYGQYGMGWDRLRKMGERGIHFVGFHPPPHDAGEVPNLHVAPPWEWTGADLAASCDIAVAKAGYGTVCEVIVAGTPFIYPPRTGFAEHPELERALNAWGGGIRVSPQDFNEFAIEAAIDQALTLRPGPPPFPIDGAQRVADHLIACIRQS